MYRVIRNQTLTSIRNDEKEYHTKKLKEPNKWHTAKKILNIQPPQPPTKIIHKNVIVTQPKEISEILNNFYIEKPNILRKQIDKAKVDPLINYIKLVKDMWPKPRFELETITMFQLRHIIENI